MTVGSATSARWASEKWRSATYAEPSDEEEGFDLRQPFPFVNAYPNAPAFEGRNARPLLNADSKSSSFQDAFDEQQSFWRRKWKNDPQFQQEISNCAHIQSWLHEAIDRNELSVAAIRWVASSCGTAFLKAIGYIHVIEGRDGRSIQWTRELLDAFQDGGERYAQSSKYTFLFTQAASIVASGGNVLLEAARPAMHGSTVNNIKLGIKSVQLAFQLGATPLGFLFGAHLQPTGVKGYELAGIPYALNVSSIDYKVPASTVAGDRLESVPYADAKEVGWSVNLIETVNYYCSGDRSDASAINSLLEKHSTGLKKRLTKLDGKSGSSRQQYQEYKLTKQRMALVDLAIHRVSDPSDIGVQTQFTKEEGNLRRELALAEISGTFNSSPSQSKVRAARYLAFAFQAALNLTGAATRLGHCVPRSVAAATSSIANNVTWAGSQLAEMVINGTEASQLVEECTGFNPWGFALELANFGIAIGNPVRYWNNLPQACADDYQRKFIAYSAALMLQPHGMLTDAQGAVDPAAFDLMLRGRMWRVLDCVVKTLESDLHCSASALMTHIVDIAKAPVDEPHPYEWLIVSFEALKFPGERANFMNVHCGQNRASMPEVDFLLQHYEGIIQAIDAARKGHICHLLDEHLLPPTSVQLLRSALTIAAGGAVTEADEHCWNELMRIFGDVEATSRKTEQEAQKAGQGFAKKGIAGTASFTLIKSVFDFGAAVAKSQSTFEHDRADIASKVIQILGSLIAFAGSSTGYLTSYLYWQFILEKNRQRQARLNDKFSPPNSSILNPRSESYLRGFNRDRLSGTVTQFKTLLAFPIEDTLINRRPRLTYDRDKSTFWGDMWAQINVIDLGLGVHNMRSRLMEIVHPDETLLNAEVNEISDIIESANRNILLASPDDVKRIIKTANTEIVEQMRRHVEARKAGASPSTVTELAGVLVDGSGGSTDSTGSGPGTDRAHSAMKSRIERQWNSTASSEKINGAVSDSCSDPSDIALESSD